MTVELTVGAPGSGKTTYAERKVAISRKKIININRDNIRDTMFCIPREDYHKVKSNDLEDTVTKTQLAMASIALAKGQSVIVSDTNINPARWDLWKRLADKYNVEFKTTFFPVPLKELLIRNVRREKSVPEPVIRSMVESFEKNFPEEVNYFMPKPYVEPESGPQCWIVDIDGTLAHMNGKRGPFEWHNVGVDDPDKVVIELVNMLYSKGYKIILMSGRDESCREETERWLLLHGVKYHELHMRPKGDYRPDTEIKEELFESSVATNNKVVGVLDDRNVVVDMWRKKGLKVLQVAPGDF